MESMAGDGDEAARTDGDCSCRRVAAAPRRAALATLLRCYEGGAAVGQEAAQMTPVSTLSSPYPTICSAD